MAGPNRHAENKAVDQQHDTDNALDREHGRSDRMRMPHERDEAAVSNATDAKIFTQREVMRQAHDDIVSGQQDTDCRNMPADGGPCAQPPGAAHRGRSSPSDGHARTSEAAQASAPKGKP
ncbi:MAG TPA: hypothetical protein VFB54_06795 [Burkholderiales bacterium]|nr:hypothetical protein [Burkholderiales bacterium]